MKMHRYVKRLLKRVEERGTPYFFKIPKTHQVDSFANTFRIHARGTRYKMRKVDAPRREYMVIEK